MTEYCIFLLFAREQLHATLISYPYVRSWYHHYMYVFHVISTLWSQGYISLVSLWMARSNCLNSFLLSLARCPNKLRFSTTYVYGRIRPFHWTGLQIKINLLIIIISQLHRSRLLMIPLELSWWETSTRTSRLIQIRSSLVVTISPSAYCFFFLRPPLTSSQFDRSRSYPWQEARI